MLLLISSRLTLLQKHQGFTSCDQHAGLCGLCCCEVFLTIMRFFSRYDGKKLWMAHSMVKCVLTSLVSTHKWWSSTSYLVLSLGRLIFITLTAWARSSNTRHNIYLHPKVMQCFAKLTLSVLQKMRSEEYSLFLLSMGPPRASSVWCCWTLSFQETACSPPFWSWSVL